MPTTLAFIPNIGPWEMVFIVLLVVLLFGRRAPSVGRSLANGIVEFRKGLKGIQTDLDSAGDDQDANPYRSKSSEPKRLETANEGPAGPVADAPSQERVSRSDAVE